MQATPKPERVCRETGQVGAGQGDIMDGGLVTAMHGDTREAQHTSWLRQDLEDWRRCPQMHV